MSRCLNLSQAGEYAISALCALALEPGRPRSARWLARVQRIPQSFLAKILHHCARAGLIRTARGYAGGAELARAPERISLLEIIEACEGRLARERCVFYRRRACVGPECEVFCPLREREEKLRESLKRSSLAQMAAALKRHPERADWEAV